MVTKIIKYSITRNFLGRNGVYSCKGIEITDMNRPKDNSKYPYIMLEPITSKNKIGRCFIEIPRENIQEVINILEKFK